MENFHLLTHDLQSRKDACLDYFGISYMHLWQILVFIQHKINQSHAFAFGIDKDQANDHTKSLVREAQNSD